MIRCASMLLQTCKQIAERDRIYKINVHRCDVSSGVVRQNAAWGENKKCRPCLYFLRLLRYDSSSFD